MCTIDNHRRLQRIQGRSDEIRALEVGQFVEVSVRDENSYQLKRDRNNIYSICSKLRVDYGVEFAVRNGSERGKLFVLRLR